ncbi:MAG: ABC-type transport auxiliary lipoprotein family protein [Salaquimonas sp.]|jgi:phospholipid/cholesterol/gamma-HCH transport system substrate-binding protein|nr:ABC-type transport auxiliary lipoprotein family protein [Salaquimonas sp.]
MEFKARYILTGLFAVAVIVAMFAFVYWLDNKSGFGERATYQVRFTVPITGLSTGADVLFNGVKVGEVERIQLDAANPGDLIATISIAAATPVHADTGVGIDYQGLTGAANVLLTGGSLDAPRLVGDAAHPPMLQANPDASRSWTQKAGRILGVLDNMLEKNSGRFDAILAGLAKLAGGDSGKDKKVTHDLLAATSFPSPADTGKWQLSISEPSVVLALNTDRILERVDGDATRPIDDARWADSLPALFQARIIQSFENAGYLDVMRPADAPDPDYNLAIDIRGFWLIDKPRPAGAIDLVVKVLDRNGAVVAAHHFQAQVPATGTGEAAAASALGEVFTSTTKQLVTWTASNLK